jgi:hypothetical protein
MSRGAAEDNPITSPLLRPTASACDDYIIVFVAPTLPLTILVCSHLLARKSHLDPKLVILTIPGSYVPICQFSEVSHVVSRRMWADEL